MSEQLFKKGPSGHINVMPKSWIDAIRDRATGMSLTEILQGFNMYYLSYTGDVATTRNQIPIILRREGLWITYIKYDNTVVTEWYNSNKTDDDSWANSSNWRVANNTLVGDISISSNGNWVINGKETEFKAQGDTGTTPLLRVGDNNKLQVSYNEGKAWSDISDYIVPHFRWLQGEDTTVGTIQISKDLGNTWENLSNPFVNYLRISRYIGNDESLPTKDVAEGTIYMKGPYYSEDDTSNSIPLYRMWVYAWKGDTLAWQDNGEFVSFKAGIVQSEGDSESVVMSQKATTDAIKREEEARIFDVTNLDGKLKQEANVRNNAVNTVQTNLNAEVKLRENVYKGHLDSFAGTDAEIFVNVLLDSIGDMGFGKYSFDINNNHGSKQYVTYSRVGSVVKLTIEGCLKAEVLNGDGVIDSLTSTVSTIVECDVTKKVWSYVNTVVDDTYYPEMWDEINVDEEAVQRSNKVMSKEQTLGAVLHLFKSKTVYLSESEYKTLAENNQIKDDVEYNIYEDEE